jgi:ABC-2 type transport system ATP-binding protein
VASHALAEIAQTVDDVVVIRDGRSILQASLDRLLAEHAGDVRVTGRDAEELGELLRAAGMHVMTPAPGTIVVRDRNEVEILRFAARHRLVISAVSSLGPTLEDIYLELTASPIGGSR